MLAASGISQLYSHQAESVELALAGADLVVVTPTASGKTLCYQLPVLDRLLGNPESCALYLFPTKALAHDQLHGLQAALGLLGMDEGAATYDGDTPQHRRRAVRESARILISNPDMLHVGILPRHVAWRHFMGQLDYVVVDEMHAYRGVFGSHVSHVLGRLRRLCRFYGSDPQFICASATIANPTELGRGLVGKPLHLVCKSGAPTSRRHVVLYNPPIVEPRLGIRRSPLQDAQYVARALLRAGQQLVCFTRSRLAVEQLVIALRKDAAMLGLAPQAVRGYRAGYLGSERRAIESGLRDGTVHCVVATSALELGIDIGGLGACVLVGYPGSISSTWQRIGRVGRGALPGTAVLVASGSPLDQFVIAHPDHLLQGEPESARINPDNLHVRLGQVRAALYEMAIPDGQAENDRELGAILGALESVKEVRSSGGRWFWSTDSFPAAEISLRSADAHRVVIVTNEGSAESCETIGEVERTSAPRCLHQGAVYMHEGRQYQVERLDLEEGVAHVVPVELDHMTIASERTEIEIERVDHLVENPSMTVGHGEIRLTSQVTSFRREHLETHEILGWGTVDLPEQVMFTSACWLGIQSHVVEELEAQGLWSADVGGDRGPNWESQRLAARQRDGYRCRQCGSAERPGRGHDVHHIVPFREFGWIPGKNDLYRQANHLSNLMTLCPRCHRLAERQVAMGSTLSDLSHLMRHLVPLWLLCDAGDIGTHVDSAGRRHERPTLFVYDRIPGGAGLADELPRLIEGLLGSAQETVARCPCPGGCPACIGPSITLVPGRKESVLALLSILVTH